jgi:hypothetical protein
LIFTCFLDRNLHSRDGTSVMLLRSLIMRHGS